MDALRFTSSLGEYIAAGVTTLIPGTGLAGTLLRNIIAEGICLIEETILGKEVDAVASMIDIGIGTLLDMGFEKVTDKVTDFIGSKLPQNYSSYAHTLRQSNPDLNRGQIYQSMRRSIRVNRIASKSISIGFDIVRTMLY